MIYRAICYCTHERMRNVQESVVFIQGSARDDAAAKLCRVLADIWNVPADTVDFYNLNSAPELFANAVGGSHSGDARFFEIGSHGELPIYLDDDAPLLLLGPEANTRLLEAWKDVRAMRKPASASRF